MSFILHTMASSKDIDEFVFGISGEEDYDFPYLLYGEDNPLKPPDNFNHFQRAQFEEAWELEADVFLNSRSFDLFLEEENSDNDSGVSEMDLASGVGSAKSSALLEDLESWVTHTFDPNDFDGLLNFMEEDGNFSPDMDRVDTEEDLWNDLEKKTPACETISGENNVVANTIFDKENQDEDTGNQDEEMTSELELQKQEHSIALLDPVDEKPEIDNEAPRSSRRKSKQNIRCEKEEEPVLGEEQPSTSSIGGGGRKRRNAGASDRPKNEKKERGPPQKKVKLHSLNPDEHPKARNAINAYRRREEAKEHLKNLENQVKEKDQQLHNQEETHRQQLQEKEQQLQEKDYEISQLRMEIDDMKGSMWVNPQTIQPKYFNY